MDVHLTMDNDSGYVSHCQESSHLDSFSEGICKPKSLTRSDLYLNEDALLEVPTVGKTFQRSDSTDSIINDSQDSVKTNFSGFADSDVEQSGDVSLVLPQQESITFKESRNGQMAISCNDSLLGNNSRESSLMDISTQSLSTSNSTLTTCEDTSMSVLTNITNTFSYNESVISTGPVKVNTPKKQYESRQNPDFSPDLFEDDYDDDNAKIVQSTNKENARKSSEYCTENETKLLKRVQMSLSGVCPPPSVTIMQITASEMLAKIESNKDLFWTNQETNRGTSLLLETEGVTSLDKVWPEVLNSRFHGLHYNRNKTSEEFEHLCSKYAERYVGVETQSSCVSFDSISSPQKRKYIKPKWGVKSPGRRLSHLARRRITFSSANLQASSSSAILGSRARQIMVDVKKFNSLNKKRSPRKSPRKTPSKSPFRTRRTPSSSAKKKLALRFRQMSGELESIAPSIVPSQPASVTYKRALFQSPSKSSQSSSSASSMEKKPTKRALFSSPAKSSPNKKSPFKQSIVDRKRKRIDFDEGSSAKFSRTMSLDLRQSQPDYRSLMNRTLSDSTLSLLNSAKTEELSELHKKKLQWAVYESLRLQKITPTHPQYKTFASVLARVTRRFLPTVRSEGGTTEKMFRIARCHSYAVIQGKSVDEIVNLYIKNRVKNQKPHGYVAKAETVSKSVDISNKENVLQDKVNILQSIERRREHAAGGKSSFKNESKIDRIRKVICFDENTR